VARLPAGSLEPGGLADLLVVDSVEALLRGERSSIALVIAGGKRLYGLRHWLSDGSGLHVDGAPRRLFGVTAARVGTLLKAHPAARRALWLEGVEIDS
jgi:hypothetical protein